MVLVTSIDVTLPFDCFYKMLAENPMCFEKDLGDLSESLRSFLNKNWINLLNKCPLRAYYLPGRERGSLSHKTFSDLKCIAPNILI